MISEKEHDELTKEKHNREYLDMLDKSMDEAKHGDFIIKSLNELKEYER